MLNIVNDKKLIACKKNNNLNNKFNSKSSLLLTIARKFKKIKKIKKKQEFTIK